MQLNRLRVDLFSRYTFRIFRNPAAGAVRLGLALLLSLGLAACQAAAPAVTPTRQVSNTGTPTLPQPRAATTPRPSPTAPSSLLPNPSALNGVKITFWHPWAGPEDTAIRQIVDEFNSSNIWGIKAAVSTHGGDGTFEADLRKASDSELPQLVAAPSDLLSELQYDKRPLVDMSPYISDSQWGLSADEVKDFQPSFWAQDLNQGMRPGIPAWMDAHYIYYNLTWAKELGFPAVPASPYDLRSQACAAAEANLKDQDKINDGTGGWFVSTDGLSMLSWLSAFNDPETFTSGNPFVFDTQPNRGAFIFLRSLYDHNCAWTGRSVSPYDYFSTRRALFYSGTLRDITSQVHIQKQKKNEDEWMLMPYPTRDGNPLVIAEGYSYAMFQGSPSSQMAAWLLARWLELPRNQASLAAAAGAIPVSNAGLQAMSDFRKQNPHFNQALELYTNFQAAPASNHWLRIRPILEDASWQLFQPNQTLENVSAILKELDATIKVVLEYKG